MQAIVTTIWRGVTWIGRQTGDLIVGLWDGIAAAFLWIAEWLSRFVESLVAALLELVFSFAELALDLLPDMPDMGTGGVGDVSALSTANQYLPVSEALALLGVWSAIFTAVGIYKLVKLVSPVSS